MQLRKGQRALVMGLAKSGEAVARLLLKRGLSVIVNERKDRSADDFAANQLEALGATLVFSGHPLSLLEPRPDFIVKNPGIPYTVPLLVEAARLNIPILTEIEVASWLLESPIYAISGSNGKTTTTTLVGEMLEQAGQNPVVAGNIGRVLSGVVEQVEAGQPVVLEVSSFQLLGTFTFHPQIAALLNIYPAHLDYHQSFEQYQSAKWRLFQNLGREDVAVLNYDSPLLREKAPSLTPQIVWFSRQKEVSQGTFISNGNIVIRKDGTDTVLMKQSSLALKGDHNVENALAAAAIATWAGASREAIIDVLTRFRGVEHRCEFVCQAGGVDYYNDSKATNPQAALRALRSFPENIVWIAGGLNRGDDVSVLVPELHARVRAAILLGQSAERLAVACRAAEIPTVERVGTLEQAVLLAHRLARPNDVVLLSPACASWDMFTSFEERGRMFKEIVHTL